MNERRNEIIDDQLSTTIQVQQKEIQELQSTIATMKEDHRNKIKELISKHVKQIQQSVKHKENLLQMVDQTQSRNRIVDTRIEFLMGFINSAKISNEYTKYKKKMKIEI